MEKGRSIEKRVKECEMELEEARSLAKAREKLLLANIRELNEVYESLREKVRQIKDRDERIRNFDEILTRASRLSSLGELAASIAHEIKNPLISIEGFAKRIEKSSDLEKVREYATFIEKESDRLSHVLMRLLDFARMRGPAREYLDVNSVVDETILFTEHHLTAFGNVSITVAEEDQLPQVCVDKIHVQQALINLVMNAAQAMPAGGAVLVRTGRRGTDYAWISVSDEGIGIDEEQLERIFEPFFTTKARGEGTGLGLSLTKKLVEANGGKIEVESTKGKGSTFRLLLPIREDA